jgi:hypothetical protein
MRFRELVFTMACPDIVADPLKLFADASNLPAALADGNNGVASARVGRGLVREERHLDRFGFHFDCLQLKYQHVQRGSAR